jgi:hypothetical protein
MWQKGKDFLVKIALVISPLEATQRRTDFVNGVEHGYCRSRLQDAFGASKHARV